MILEVGGHFFAGVEACLELGMGYVACHDDGAFQIDACAYGILGELCAHCIDALVEVDFYACRAFTWTAILFGDEF